MESNWNSHTLLMGTLESSCQFLVELNIHLPYDLAMACLNIHPREMKNSDHTQTCAWMFMVAQKWKQCTYESRIWRNCQVYSMECYSVIKLNKLLIPTIIWMTLKGIMLSERSQSQSSVWLECCSW